LPRVWLLTAYRAGEQSQLLALAEALGWPFQIKRLVHRRLGSLLDVWRGTTLAGIVRHRSSPLTPPWPDLVIAAGMRNEPVARWIRRQSGGQTRLVHVGRPWAALDRFELVVTTPQYRLPDHPRVLHNQTTLQRVTSTRLADAARQWQPRLAHLPRPYIAVIVGGPSGPYTLDAVKGDRLGRAANAMAQASGGALLVTTSARTPVATTDALVAVLTAPANICRWTPQLHDNPYYGYLALADALIVTCDSIAMLSEACATGKPVYMFDLGEGSDRLAPPVVDGDPPPGWDGARLRAWGYRQLMRFGPRRLSRDLRLVHQQLIASGRAIWLGQPFPAATPPPLDDVQRAVARVQALFAAGATPPAP
jgi:mitochondrial fission protein ELM1